MQQSLSDLRLRLGAAYRVQIDAEPHRRKHPVVTTVRWSCGCAAEGAHLRRLTLAACRDHRPAVVPVRQRFRAPLAALGITR